MRQCTEDHLPIYLKVHVFSKRYTTAEKHLRLGNILALSRKYLSYMTYMHEEKFFPVHFFSIKIIIMSFILNFNEVHACESQRFSIEPNHKKKCLPGFRPDQTQKLESRNFGYK